MMKLIFILDYNHFGGGYLSVAAKAAPFCDRIWFRAKERTDREILELAFRLRGALPGSTLILSGRADIAECAGFDGVHLNAGTLPPFAVKESFPGLIVGYSAHSAQECLECGADYVTLSPIFNTKKSYEVCPLGVIPAPGPNVYALGGVNLDTVGALEGMGYEGVAGITLFSDIEAMYRRVAGG